MSIERIRHTQRVIGVEDDGFWGPVSTDAAKRYLRSLMPAKNPWPKQDQSSLTAFYGPPGDESRLVLAKVPCTIKVKYVGKEIGKPGCEDDVIYCHERVAESLMRILVEIGKTNPGILLKYYGAYNNRPMRGGRLPSLHARGAAIDLAAATNGNTTHWPTRADMPIEVLACFAREGWLSAGVFWSRDAMHNQATQ